MNRILFNDGVSIFSEDWIQQFNAVDNTVTNLLKYLVEKTPDRGGILAGFDVIPNTNPDKFDIVHTNNIYLDEGLAVDRHGTLIYSSTGISGIDFADPSLGVVNYITLKPTTTDTTIDPRTGEYTATKRVSQSDYNSYFTFRVDGFEVIVYTQSEWNALTDKNDHIIVRTAYYTSTGLIIDSSQTRFLGAHIADGSIFDNHIATSAGIQLTKLLPNDDNESYDINIPPANLEDWLNRLVTQLKKILGDISYLDPNVPTLVNLAPAVNKFRRSGVIPEEEDELTYSVTSGVIQIEAGKYLSRGQLIVIDTPVQITPDARDVLTVGNILTKTDSEVLAIPGPPAIIDLAYNYLVPSTVHVYNGSNTSEYLPIPNLFNIDYINGRIITTAGAGDIGPEDINLYYSSYLSRIDLIYFNSDTRLLEVLKGTPSKNPEFPSVPANSVPFLFVFIDQAKPQVTIDDIISYRDYIEDLVYTRTISSLTQGKAINKIEYYSGSEQYSISNGDQPVFITSGGYSYPVKDFRPALSTSAWTFVGDKVETDEYNRHETEPGKQDVFASIEIYVKKNNYVSIVVEPEGNILDDLKIVVDDNWASPYHLDLSSYSLRSVVKLTDLFTLEEGRHNIKLMKWTNDSVPIRFSKLMYGASQDVEYTITVSNIVSEDIITNTIQAFTTETNQLLAEQIGTSSERVETFYGDEIDFLKLSKNGYDLYTCEITTQAEFNAVLGNGPNARVLEIANDGVGYFNINIHPIDLLVQSSTGYGTDSTTYKLNHKVYLNSSNIRIKCLGGAKIEYTVGNAGFFILDDSHLPVQQYNTGTKTFEVLLPYFFKINPDVDTYGDVISINPGDVITAFSPTGHKINKKYTVASTTSQFIGNPNFLKTSTPTGSWVYDNIRVLGENSGVPNTDLFDSVHFKYNNEDYFAYVYHNTTSGQCIGYVIYKYNFITGNLDKITEEGGDDDDAIINNGAGLPVGSTITKNVNVVISDNRMHVFFGVNVSGTIRLYHTYTLLQNVAICAQWSSANVGVVDPSFMGAANLARISLFAESDSLVYGVATNNLASTVFFKPATVGVPDTTPYTWSLQNIQSSNIGELATLTSATVIKNDSTLYVVGVKPTTHTMNCITSTDNGSTWSSPTVLLTSTGKVNTNTLLKSVLASNPSGPGNVVYMAFTLVSTGGSPFTTESRFCQLTSTPSLTEMETLASDTHAVNYIPRSIELEYLPENDSIYLFYAHSHSVGTVVRIRSFTTANSITKAFILGSMDEWVGIISQDQPFLKGHMATLGAMFLGYYDQNALGGTYNGIMKYKTISKITVNETIPEAGLTDIVLSNNTKENIVLDLLITSGSAGTAVGISNSIGTDAKVKLEYSSLSNGIECNHKTIACKIYAHIDDDNTVTNNINKCIHSNISGNLVKNGTKQLNDCYNVIFDGLLDKEMTQWKGDVDE